MGSCFSTRWGQTIVRETTDCLPKLDVRWLSRIGALEPGAASYPTWLSNEVPLGGIVTSVRGDGCAVVLCYEVIAHAGIRQRREEQIALDATRCTYGGQRSWFLCPGCGSRRAVLFYLHGHFRCRSCHHLAYGSTRQRQHTWTS
jgi:hypothetical protein